MRTTALDGQGREQNKVIFNIEVVKHTQFALLAAPPCGYRTPGEVDVFQWYCENCGHKLHGTFAEIADIMAQLPPIMNAFWQDDAKQTCQNCGTYKEAPALPADTAQ